MVALLVGAAVAAAMIGQSLRQSVGSAPEPVATAEQREASPNRVAPAVPAPARQPEPTVNPAVPAIVATPAAPALTATPPPTPTTTPTSPARVADLDELLQAPPSTQLRWVRFKANRGIVVIEYPNLQEQGLAMNRLAAMFEKRTARRDRVPSDAELAALLRRSGDSVASFYQGHDYPAAKVARFEAVAQEPLVRAVLDRFPGAEIVAVRDVVSEEIAPAMPESDSET